MDKSIHISRMADIIEEIVQSGASFEFSPHGISMRPSVADGDTVTLKKACFPLKMFDIALYRRTNGSVVMHRVVGRLGKSYMMAGDAQKFVEYPVGADSIIGVVAKVTRCGKEVKCLRSNAFVSLFFRDMRLFCAKLRLILSLLYRKFIKRKQQNVF